MRIEEPERPPGDAWAGDNSNALKELANGPSVGATAQ
jgi:hypothetical protein